MSLLTELKRRNVFRVGIAYAIGAWLLLQLTDVLSELLKLPDTIGPIVVTAVLIGFPIVLIAAWALELTPEGIKREEEVDRSTSITPRTGRTLDRTIIVLLALVVAGFLVKEFLIQPQQADQVAVTTTNAAPAEPLPPSVAVLPFLNMSDSDDNEYFSDGLTETLLHMLAQLPELRVAARTSSFSFKGKDATIAEIAQALNVAHVLEGSVQRAGEQVRVTAQLIRVEDGFHVWSQNYTRPMQDIFAIQDEIATDVATALDVSLLQGGTMIQGPETQDLDAYETFLKALKQQSSFSYASLEAAEGLFKQALADDPGFLDAQIGLARNYILKNGTGLITDAELFERIEPLLAQIREQYPDNPQARAFELMMDTRQPGILNAEQLHAIKDELRGLLAVIPEETMVRFRVAQLMGFLDGDMQGGVDILKAGLLVDPRSSALHSFIGQWYMDMERFDEARTELETALELDPSQPGTYTRLSWLAQARNDLAMALRWKRRAIEVDPQDHEIVLSLARTFYDLELLEEGDRWARRTAALVPGSDFVTSLAIARAEANRDWQNAMSLAVPLIESEATLREGVFSDAVNVYAEAAVRLGKAREAFAFIAQQHPEATDFSTPITSPSMIDLRMNALFLMLTFAPREEVIQAWELVQSQMLNLGFDWQGEASMRLFDRVVHQDFEAAAPEALELLNEPLASFPGGPRFFELSFLAEVVEVPDVAARLAETQREWDVMREEVIAMLQEPEWQ